jgi:hypothetical protein
LYDLILLAFIDHPKISGQNVSIAELMEPIGFWESGKKTRKSEDNKQEINC